MVGLIAGFWLAVVLILAADNISGSKWALPFALLVLVGAIALAYFDTERKRP